MSRAMMICMFATTLAVSAACFALAPNVVAQKLYDQLDQSLANHDLDQVLGFYDSSYVGTNAQGKREAFADLRKRMEQNFPLFRRMNPSTTVEDVQLDAGRMVVYSKSEMRLEFYRQRNCWVPEIYKGSGSDIWEKKGDQWKIVRSTISREDTQIDPNWAAIAAAKSASRLAKCASDRIHSCYEINPPGDTLCKSE